MKQDICKLLPYLNATMKGLDYSHDAKVLLCTDGEKTYAFRPHEFAIAPISNEVEARELAERLVAKVNAVWEKKNEIALDTTGRKPLPSVLDIYRLLPKSNCKEWSSPMFMAFAAALRSNPAKLLSCRYLSEEDHKKLALS